MLNVLILAAHADRIPANEEPDIPVCLTEIEGKPLLELLVKAVSSLMPAHMVFAFMKQDIEHWELDYVVKQLVSHPDIISVEKPTAGAACTALLGMPYIDNEDELLILSANELVRQDIAGAVNQFRSQGVDAGVLYFNSVHPRYAYVRLNEEGFVVEAAEKKPVSRNAIPGIFWFAQGRKFIKAAQETIRKDSTVRNRFFISSTLNELILQHARIGVFPIDINQYIPLKTEKQLEQYEMKSMLKGV